MLTKILMFSYVLYAMYRTVQSTSYDQSQSGDLNVQVDLKGIHIIALMKGGKEEYVDYDYAYDYSEMTIKPLNGTTPKPLNVTSASTVAAERDNATTTTAAATTANAYDETTTLPPATVTGAYTKPPLSPISKETATPIESGTIDQFNSTTPAQNLNSTSNSFNSTNSCRKGYVMNQKGDCELKLQNAGTNALLKLVKLSQKLKLRRERKPTIVHRTQGKNTA